MTCTHLIDPMSAFCRCALDPERDHCGVYSELCHGNNWPCYADLGPWGAWRSCADMLTAIYTGLEESGVMDVPIIVFSWGETATNYDLFRNIAWDELTAVGWSP